MYEKQLIAAMNNFEAAQAWRYVISWRHGYEQVFGYWREAHRKYDTAVGAGYGLQEQIKALQKELCASREENRAIREETSDFYIGYTNCEITLYESERENLQLRYRTRIALESALTAWGVCWINLWAQVLLILP